MSIDFPFSPSKLQTPPPKKKNKNFNYTSTKPPDSLPFNGGVSLRYPISESCEQCASLQGKVPQGFSKKNKARQQDMPVLSYKIILLALLEVQFRLIHLHYTFLSDVDFTFRYFNLWILQYLMLSVGSFGNWQPEFIRIKPTRLQNSHWLGLENRASCVGKTFGPRSVTPVPFVVNALVLAKLRLFFSYKAFQSNLFSGCLPTNDIIREAFSNSMK